MKIIFTLLLLFAIGSVLGVYDAVDNREEKKKKCAKRRKERLQIERQAELLHHKNICGGLRWNKTKTLRLA